MVSAVNLLLDLVALTSGLLASWLWYLSGRRRVRRVSYTESIDAADLNRLVVAINRTSILNARAALAAALSSACLAVRLGIGMLTG